MAKLANDDDDDDVESPYDRANLFTIYFLSYMLPLFRKAKKRLITSDDLGPPPRVDKSQVLGAKLQQAYKRQKKKTRKKKKLEQNKQEPTDDDLIKSLLRVFGPQLLLFSLMSACAECVAYPMTVISMGWLIRDCEIYLNLHAASNAATLTAATTPTVPSPGQSAAGADYVMRPLADNYSTLNHSYSRLAVEGSGGELGLHALLTSQDQNQVYRQVVYDAISLIAFQALALALYHPFFTQSAHIGMKCRVAACSLVYKKALRLNQAAMSETTVGQMVNLLSNDVSRFDHAALMLPYLIIAPLQAILALAILSIFYLGLYPTLASFTTIILLVIVQSFMGRAFSKYREQTAQRTDERVRLVNEVILAMKIIKTCAWEEPFKERVNAARKRETNTIGKSYVLRTINQTLYFASSKVIIFVALMTYVSIGSCSLHAETLFVAIGLAGLVKVSLTLFFPDAIAYAAETLISCKRLSEFLALPELKSSSIEHKSTLKTYRRRSSSSALNGGGGGGGKNSSCKFAISMSKVYASWVSVEEEEEEEDKDEARRAIIRNLTLAVELRELVLIVGRVGSGKSSLLMALLGELPVASGRIAINGRLAYASQEAWIFSGSVRDNILFGEPYERDRYAEVVRVCSLQRDLDLLADGDSTLVGERGVSLSGGQKARVNLARALYQDADIYLLDDPLSAVDAPVARHIFSESVKSFLRNKTVLLATHQLQFLRDATKVLVIDRNLPAAFGAPDEVMRSEAFASLTQSAKEGLIKPPGAAAAANDDSDDVDDDEFGQKFNIDAQETTTFGAQASSNLTGSIEHLLPFSAAAGKKRVLSSADGTSDECLSVLGQRKAATAHSESAEPLGSISSNWRTYLYYLRNAAGPALLTWFIFTNILAQALSQGTDYFLSLWTDSVQRRELKEGEGEGEKGAAGDFEPTTTTTTTFVDKLSLGQISGIYGGLIGLLLLAAFIRVATFFAGALRASINMHKKMINCVMRAPMSFFDRSPIGMLLNRLSRDFGFVDESLPATANEALTICCDVLGICVLALSLDIANSIAVIVLFAALICTWKVCASAIMRLKSIEGATKSPIFSHLSTTLAGLPTIRVFASEERFVAAFDRLQDAHSSAWFYYLSAGRWLEITLSWILVLFMSIVIVIVVAFSLDTSSASFIGLLISQLLEIPGPFQWAARLLVEVGSEMTSVQRIKEFSELKSEKDELEETRTKMMIQSPREHDADRKTSTAGEGAIKFVDVSLCYFPDKPPVLKRLNLRVKPREKIGIVGRTGAGKSSIVSVLFRLYDFEGRVEIDGRDTKTMRLADVRRAMSIIPQEPILFGASIRKNLDPFGEHSDAQLWQALEAVQLQQVFGRHAQGLEYAITEGGSNFSVGQRQLICLARAIVRRTKILVLDEATANVDPETDAFIQRTIARQFANCTVLTIAHRLITIVDSDRVLVLDGGEISEFGAPHELLANERGIFAQMVASSAQQAPRIVKLIEEAAHKKRHKTRRSSTCSQEEQ